MYQPISNSSHLRPRNVCIFFSYRVWNIFCSFSNCFKFSNNSTCCFVIINKLIEVYFFYKFFNTFNCFNNILQKESLISFHSIITFFRIWSFSSGLTALSDTTSTFNCNFSSRKSANPI